MAEAHDAPSIDGLLVHRRFVRALARALVHGEAAIDDLEQETWLRACQSPPAADRGVRGWLKRIVRNAAVDSRRGDERRLARETGAAPSEPQPSAESIAARLETERRLVAAVETLDERYRRVVFLRFFEDLPPRKAAKRLGVPVDTIRTQTARALEQLRKKLDEAHGGGRRDWLAAMVPLAMAPASVVSKVTSVAATALLLGLAIPISQMLDAAERRPSPVAGTPPSLARTEAVTAASSTAPTHNDTASIVADTKWPACIRGTVVGPLRTPIANAKVELFQFESRETIHATRTNADGSFAFEGIPYGTYFLGASARGHVSTQRRVYLDPGCSVVDSLRLTLWKSRDIRGTVVDTTGGSVPGARVVVTLGIPNNFEWPTRSTSTDQEGRFLIVDAPMNPVTVDVFASGLLPLRQQVLSQEARDTTLRMPAGQPTSLHVRLEFDAPLSAEEDSGPPIELTLSASEWPRPYCEFHHKLIVSLTPKETDVPDLAPLHYSAVARRAGEYLTVDPRDLDLTRGSSPSLRIHIANGNAEVVVAGRVIDENGLALPRAAFTVFSNRRDADATRVACDDAGAFTFSRSRAKGKQCVALPDDPRRALLPGKGRKARIDLTQSGAIELRSVPCERISGRIVDSSDRPVAGAQIDLDCGDPQGPETITNVASDGRFELSGSLANHRLVFDLYGDFGLLEIPLSETLAPGEDRQGLVVRVPRLARVRGRVVDSDGAPQPGLWIRAKPSTAKRLDSDWFWNYVACTAFTDEKGRFVLDSIHPSTTVIALGGDPRSISDVTEIPVTFNEGEERDDVTWVFARRRASPDAIRVRVVWPDGEREPGAFLFVQPNDGEAIHLDRTALAQIPRSRAATGDVVATFIGTTSEGAIFVQSPVVHAEFGGPEVAIELPRPAFGRLTARLPDGVSASDLAEMRVQLWLRLGGEDQSTRSLEVAWHLDGSVLIVGPLASGHYDSLRFEAPGIRPFMIPVDVLPDRSRDLGVLPMEARAPVTWTVVDETGAAIGDAEFLENADLLLPSGRTSTHRRTLHADEAGLIDIPGNTDSGVFRASGYAPCQLNRSPSKSNRTVLLREASLRLRDVPVELLQTDWHWEIELLNHEASNSSYPRWLFPSWAQLAREGDVIGQLPATAMTIHVLKGNERQAMPPHSEPGRYYRVDVTLIAGETTDVSIAPNR